MARSTSKTESAQNDELDPAIEQLRRLMPKPNGNAMVLNRPLTFFADADDLRRLVLLCWNEKEQYKARLQRIEAVLDLLREKASG